VYQFSCNPFLLESLDKLGVESATLGTVPLIRIDRPKDTMFSTPWHQDQWYSFSSPQSVVLWMPLGNMSENIGTLRVVPSSHKNGTMDFIEYKGGREPFEPLHAVDEKKAIDVDVQYGEVLIFRQNLLHKSGFNQSDKCRVTMQLRYNKMRSQESPFTTFTARHSDYVQDNQKKYKKD
jgi:ectoine hydroxylase-related dioxygenase (phytanoyl-CoA dioxygenase family)